MALRKREVIFTICFRKREYPEREGGGRGFPSEKRGSSPGGNCGYFRIIGLGWGESVVVIIQNIKSCIYLVIIKIMVTFYVSFLVKLLERFLGLLVDQMCWSIEEEEGGHEKPIYRGDCLLSSFSLPDLNAYKTYELCGIRYNDSPDAI